MIHGKWIPEVTAQTALEDAACRVLSVRLEVVRNHLQMAREGPGEDIEAVHQLRVGTRRAGAAVEIFSICLPQKAYKRARKQLRRIRRAAGEARDWDVFLDGLRSKEHAEAARNKPGLEFLAGYAFSQRLAAQTRLEQACPEYPFELERLCAATVAAVRAPQTDCALRTLVDLARPTLTELVHELEAAAAKDPDDYGNLHRVRIAGKRLRYAMEVFANCFAPPFREDLYPLVEEVQEILGRANDSHIASQRLRLLLEQVRGNRLLTLKRLEPGLRKLLRFHEHGLPQERRRFQEWRKRWEQKGGPTALAALLATPAGNDSEIARQRANPVPGGGPGGGPGLEGRGAGIDGITGPAPPGGAGPKAGAGATGAPTPP